MKYNSVHMLLAIKLLWTVFSDVLWLWWFAAVWGIWFGLRKSDVRRPIICFTHDMNI
jgi:hypothetical protein